MSSLSRSPRLRRGAIIAIDSLAPVPKVIPFQYNPSQMKRSLTPRMSGADSSKAEVARIEGPPQETITLKVEFDATDGLERLDPLAMSMGVYHQLSALEMLIYPRSQVIIKNTVLTALGTIEIVPPAAPLTLLVWGPKRVLPVRIETFSIDEEEWDERLNPIRAAADLSLRVLSYADYESTDPGYYMFLAHQVAKEAMGGMAISGSLNII